MSFTITEAPATTYRMRGERTWADITIREWKGGGSIDVQSDYGSFSHSWSAIGRGSFRDFLISLDFGYFMEKARPSYMEFDRVASVAQIKRDLIEARRQGEIGKSDARHMFNNLCYFDDVIGQHGYYDVVDKFFVAGLYEWVGDAPAIKRPKAQCVAFWDGPWSAICDHWRRHPVEAKQTQTCFIGGVRDGEFTPISRPSIRVPVSPPRVFDVTEGEDRGAMRIEIDEYMLREYRHPATGQSANFYVLIDMPGIEVIKRLDELFPSGLPGAAA